MFCTEEIVLYCGGDFYTGDIFVISVLGRPIVPAMPVVLAAAIAEVGPCPGTCQGGPAMDC